MGGHLLMSSKELKRKSVLELVKNKHITLRRSGEANEPRLPPNTSGFCPVLL
jgi:hypothetical protein